MAALVLEEQIPHGGHAHGSPRTDAKTLEKTGGHVAAIGTGFRGANGGGEGDDSTDYEDNAAAVYIGKGGPEERADSETEGGDGNGPIYLRVGYVEVDLELGEGGDGGCGYVCEHEISGGYVSDPSHHADFFYERIA